MSIYIVYIKISLFIYFFKLKGTWEPSIKSLRSPLTDTDNSELNAVLCLISRYQSENEELEELSWFGHFARMSDEKMAKKIYDGSEW